ncbi:MAG: cation:proton antiporter [Sphingopyxis sp.]|jgi:CPA2 family monovalent cation:H+ antiporter-2|nr:cation:proton antiporter [Sphingopyxis sp.]
MLDNLGEYVILLGAAMLFVILFKKIGLGAVLGYLVAGATLGPYGLGLVGGGEEKLGFAELGIALLLFLVGLELNPARLWRLKREIFGLGMTQVVLCSLALFGFLLMVTGFTWQAVLALALPLSLSSTAQVLPGLKSSGRINSPFGERAFSILLFQDLSIVPLITIIAALSRAPADPSAPPGYMLALYTVGAVVGLILAGRFLLTPLLRIVGQIGERELFTVVGLFVVIASAALMHALHLSVALGAFVAGVMLADSPYRHELEADVEPFRSILLGLFFLAVGMVLDLNVIRENPGLVVGLAVALVAIKTAIIWGIARAFGMAWRPALALALLLSQGGEFGFVLFAQAQDALLIEREAASLFSAVVTLSMATTPFLMLFARFLEYSREDKGAEALEGPAEAPNGRAIIVGYGRFGQTVSQMLQAVDCSVTLIDKKPAQIELSGKFDVKVYYGDGLRLDVLEMAGAKEADVIALCLDDRNMTAAQIEPIRHAFPNARIFARAFDRRQVMALSGSAVDGSVREVFESAVAMGLLTLQAIDIAPDEIADAEAAMRQLDSARLQAQIDSGDLRAGIDWRFGADDKVKSKEVLERFAERLRGNG